jgi:hypothetical protein
MNTAIEKLVQEADKLLADPTRYSLAYIIERAYAIGVADGAEAERKALRVKLGLQVPGDEE